MLNLSNSSNVGSLNYSNEKLFQIHQIGKTSKGNVSDGNEVKQLEISYIIGQSFSNYSEC